MPRLGRFLFIFTRTQKWTKYRPYDGMFTPPVHKSGWTFMACGYTTCTPPFAVFSFITPLFRFNKWVNFNNQFRTWVSF